MGVVEIARGEGNHVENQSFMKIHEMKYINA